MSDWKRDVVRLRLQEELPWDEIIDRYKGEFPNLTHEQLRKKLSNVVRKTPEAKEKKGIPVGKWKSGNGQKKDGTYDSDKLIEICETDDITPELIMRLHGLKVDQWDVVCYRNNAWHSQVKGGTRLILYQSRLTVKPKKGPTTLFDDIRKFFETTNLDSIRTPIIPLQFDPEGETLEIDLPDLHSGLYAWIAETGANYDVKIAREFFMKGISDVLSRCHGRKFKRIIFALLGDLLHTDNDQQTTAKGTFQQVDGRMPRVFTKTLEMLIEAIDQLELIAPVDVVYTRGNHDYLTGWTLIKSLEQAYHKDPNVTVDVSPDPQKHRLIGNTLIGFVHGDMPEKNLSGWLQVRARQMTQSIKFIEVHSGHLHEERKTEIKQTSNNEGIVVRTLPTVCNSSAWEHESGYAGALRSVMCFVWDEERGLREMWYCNM